MATTPNFSWETPDDTDLVQDGALAMRTLGDSIDGDFAGLLGGSSGQVLTKNSATPLDFGWADAGGWVQLASTTLTTTTTNISGLSTAYKDLRIVVTNALQNSAPLTCFLRVGNGTASSSGYYTVKNPFSGTWTGSTTSSDLLGSGITQTNGSSTDIVCDIQNYSNADLIKVFRTDSIVSSTGQVLLGMWTSPTAINYVRFIMGATPASGTIEVYGRN